MIAPRQQDPRLRALAEDINRHGCPAVLTVLGVCASLAMATVEPGSYYDRRHAYVFAQALDRAATWAHAMADMMTLDGRLGMARWWDELSVVLMYQREAIDVLYPMNAPGAEPF